VEGYRATITVLSFGWQTEIKPMFPKKNIFSEKKHFFPKKTFRKKTFFPEKTIRESYRFGWQTEDGH
jgi:hypothetical protein